MSIDSEGSEVPGAAASSAGTPGERVVAIDVDEVLCKYSEGFMRWHSAKTGSDSASLPDVGVCFKTACSKTNAQAREAFALHPDFVQIDRVPGAREALQRIKQAGIRIEVVTSRPQSMAPATRTYLATHYPGLIAESHFAKSGEKGQICKRIGAALLVDDQLRNVIDAINAGISAVLFDLHGTYSWSNTPQAVSSLPASATRLLTWDGVVSHILQVFGLPADIGCDKGVKRSAPEPLPDDPAETNLAPSFGGVVAAAAVAAAAWSGGGETSSQPHGAAFSASGLASPPPAGASPAKPALCSINGMSDGRKLTKDRFVTFDESGPSVAFVEQPELENDCEEEEDVELEPPFGAPRRLAGAEDKDEAEGGAADGGGGGGGGRSSDVDMPGEGRLLGGTSGEAFAKAIALLAAPSRLPKPPDEDMFPSATVQVEIPAEWLPTDTDAVTDQESLAGFGKGDVEQPSTKAAQIRIPELKGVLYKKRRKLPAVLARSPVGWIASSIFWERLVFRLSEGRFEFWSSEASLDEGRPPAGTLLLSELEQVNVTSSGQDLTIRVPSSMNAVAVAEGRWPRGHKQLVLRARSAKEATRWVEAIQYASAVVYMRKCDSSGAISSIKSAQDQSTARIINADWVAQAAFGDEGSEAVQRGRHV